MTDLSMTLRWIPLFPLLGALLHGVSLALLRRPLSRSAVIGVSLGSVVASLIATGLAFAELIGVTGQNGTSPRLLDTVYTWLGVGVGSSVFSADIAFQFDALAAVMCFIVTGVGALVLAYSVGYMDADEREDRGFQRFFCYMLLFVGAMLVLVLADNLLLLFLGWEAVGLCSMLLIGFWYNDKPNARAGTKAFLIGRIADVGFILGCLLLFWALVGAGAPTVSFRGIEAGFAAIADTTIALPALLGGATWRLANVVGLCFFVSACGKSAQGPLLVWLPDAMAAPTPVSALVHAATMVTAGIYLMCRLSFVYAAAPEASAVVGWTGGFTAILAATIALAQNDIKRVLAYSTISQLGMMFVAVGCGAYAVAMLHVTIHAFAKTLLFLGAGAVILACRREQDMRELGGLWGALPITHRSMLVGVLALSGFPLMSGFFSNSEVLLAAHRSQLPGQLWLYRMMLVTSLLTSLYMFRLYFMTFHGRMRIKIARSRVNDPGSWLRQPLYALTALAVLAGLLTPPQYWGDLMGIADSDSLGNFLAGVLARVPTREVAEGAETRVILLATVAMLGGAGLAYELFLRNPALLTRITGSLGVVHRLVVERFRIDEWYDAVVVRPLLRVADRLLYRGVDQRMIDGIFVSGTARALLGLTAHGLKHAHSGYVQGYLAMMVIGLIATVAVLAR